MDHPYSSADDVVGVRSTVNELRELIDDFSGDRCLPVYKPITSLLISFSKRLSQLLTDDSEQVKTKNVRGNLRF